MSLFKHWRLVLSTAVALTVMAGFIACGDDDNGGGSTSGATTAGGSPSGDQRKQGGTLTVQSNEFQSLDPHYSNFAQDISMDRMLWRGLYTLDKDNTPQPAMAASKPTVSADGKTYTVKLKSGLKWSDGKDLVAADFVAGILRTCNPVIAGNYQYVLTAVVGCDDLFNALNGPDGKAGTGDDLKADAAGLPAKEAAVGVKAVDATTVQITLSQPQVTFPIILSLWMTFPVPTHIARFSTQTADKPADWGTDPAGLAYNGPYILQTYTQQDSVVLLPNPNWAATAGIKPTLDKLVIKFIDKKDVADNAFRSGELDEADADNTVLPTLKTEFGDKFLITPQPGTRGLEMELTHKPLDNLKVRLALSQAIDRKALNDVAAGGAFVPTTTWLPEGVGGVAPNFFDDKVGYDVQKAKDNLAAAGYPNGAGFPKLKILVRDSPDRKAQAEFLQNAFKTVLNIDTEIEAVDAKTRSARINSHDYDLAPASGWIQDYPDPENWIVGLFDTGGGNNVYSCSDPDIDALIDKAKFNTNNTERLQQYKQVNELIVTRVCGVAPYYHEAQPWIVSDKIAGMKENSNEQNASMPGDWASEAWGLKK